MMDGIPIPTSVTYLTLQEQGGAVRVSVLRKNGTFADAFQVMAIALAVGGATGFLGSLRFETSIWGPVVVFGLLALAVGVFFMQKSEYAIVLRPGEIDDRGTTIALDATSTVTATGSGHVLVVTSGTETQVGTWLARRDEEALVTAIQAVVPAQ